MTCYEATDDLRGAKVSIPMALMASGEVSDPRIRPSRNPVQCDNAQCLRTAPLGNAPDLQLSHDAVVSAFFSDVSPDEDYSTKSQPYVLC